MIISTDNSVIRNRFGDREAMRLIKEAGFDGIDYSFYDIMPDNDILALPDAQREELAYELRAYARELGLVFPQCHAELKYAFGSIEADPAHPMYRRVLRSIEYAGRMGIPQIVIHTARCPLDMPDAEADRINLEFMRSFLPYAEKAGVDIGVENLFKRVSDDRRFLGRQHTAEWMNRFVDALGDPRFKVCLDIGHAEICHSDAVGFIEGMSRDRLTMIHVQDTDFTDDRHWLPFQGKHDWAGITKALAGIGYAGAMNLEVLHFYEKFPDELIPSALRMAADTARHLAEMTEAER